MTNNISKHKSASYRAAPLGTLVKMLYVTLFPTEKKKKKKRLKELI